MSNKQDKQREITPEEMKQTLGGISNEPVYRKLGAFQTESIGGIRSDILEGGGPKGLMAKTAGFKRRI